MLIHGTPLTPSLTRDAETGDRFWYWRGFSGRSYIHTVYPVDACPPLPGAVFVAVRRTGSLRTALKAGRLPSVWSFAGPAELAVSGATEIHVHLLAADERAADGVARDLIAALSGSVRACDGFSEMAA